MKYINHGKNFLQAVRAVRVIAFDGPTLPPD